MRFRRYILALDRRGRRLFTRFDFVHVVRLRDAMMPLPNLPCGDLRSLYLHWTGDDYETVFPAYHFCVSLDRGSPAIHASHDLRDNMRALGRSEREPYAAHTAGRNSYAIGIAICGMRAALPQNFGAFPLRDDLVAAACRLAARLTTFYSIPLDAEHVRTHAEAAVEDGYFGSAAGERWDIARFVADARPLAAGDARTAGGVLRARIRAHVAEIANRATS